MVTFDNSYVDVVAIEKPNLPLIILIKLYFHPDQLKLMNLQQIKPYLMAYLQTVNNRVILHQSHVILPKLLIVKFQFPIEGSLKVPFPILLKARGYKIERKGLPQPQLRLNGRLNVS